MTFQQRNFAHSDACTTSDRSSRTEFHLSPILRTLQSSKNMALLRLICAQHNHSGPWHQIFTNQPCAKCTWNVIIWRSVNHHGKERKKKKSYHRRYPPVLFFLLLCCVFFSTCFWEIRTRILENQRLSGARDFYIIFQCRLCTETVV